MSADWWEPMTVRSPTAMPRVICGATMALVGSWGTTTIMRILSGAIRPEAFREIACWVAWWDQILAESPTAIQPAALRGMNGSAAWWELMARILVKHLAQSPSVIQ